MGEAGSGIIKKAGKVDEEAKRGFAHQPHFALRKQRERERER